MLLKKKKLGFYLCIVSLIILSSITFNNSNECEGRSQGIELAAPINVKITSPDAATGEYSYPVGAELNFEVTDSGYASVTIRLIGSKEYFDIQLTAGAKWIGNWKSINEDPPVTPDTYLVKVIIDGTTTYDGIPSKIYFTGEAFPIWLIFVIIGAAAGVAVSSLFVVKKKKASRVKDVEFGKVSKTKKKKSEVYKGASAIGKRSGQIAESVTGKIESTDVEKIDPSQASVYEFKSDRRTQVTKSDKKQLIPADSGFKFETKASSGAAIMKSMEMKLDLDSKVNFTISKVDSLLQNIGFFKAILEKQEQEELVCPTCDKKMTKFWAVCPFCEIRERDSELGLKQSIVSISGDIRFCPNCKRIIKANWNTCPFCLVLKNS
jgi:RNA polymerase subunit RPABC4/transcription elongation factor Spt4